MEFTQTKALVKYGIYTHKNSLAKWVAKHWQSAELPDLHIGPQRFATTDTSSLAKWAAKHWQSAELRVLHLGRQRFANSLAK